MTSLGLGAPHLRWLRRRTLRCWGTAGYTAPATRGRSATTTRDAAPRSTSAAASQLLRWYHTCALLGSGSVRCFGNGAPGALGYGNHGHRRRRSAGFGWRRERRRSRDAARGGGVPYVRSSRERQGPLLGKEHGLSARPPGRSDRRRRKSRFGGGRRRGWFRHASGLRHRALVRVARRRHGALLGRKRGSPRLRPSARDRRRRNAETAATSSAAGSQLVAGTQHLRCFRAEGCAAGGTVPTASSVTAGLSIGDDERPRRPATWTLEVS